MAEYQLPEHAQAFTIQNTTTRLSLIVPDFSSLLHQKILQTIGHDDDQLLRTAKTLYGEVANFDATIYSDALDRLDNLPATPHEAYYGRDAYWLYMARQAQQSTLPQSSQQPISYLFGNENLLRDPLFDAYLAQQGVTDASRHIDVGCNGATVKQIIRRLASQNNDAVSDDYQSSRIALLAAHVRSDNPLTDEASNEMGVAVRRILESRSRHTSKPTQLLRRNGKIETNSAFLSPQDEILFWTTEQAIRRSILFENTR